MDGNVMPAAPAISAAPVAPAKKNELMIGCLIGIGALIVTVITIVVIVIVSQVDYTETYEVATELKPKVYNIYQDYDCGYVREFVKSAYTTDRQYSEYVEGCRTVSNGVDELVVKLGETAGVKQNTEIREEFLAFQKSLAEVMPNQNELEENLKIYEIWHKYVVAKSNLSASSSTEAEVRSAAKILIDSGNETFKTYGEGWLEVTLAYLQAYHAYNNASYFDANKSTLRDEMKNKQTKQDNWVKANQPDVTEMGKVDGGSRVTMYNHYMKLYSLVQEMYES